ncbi:MAG: hypothetical protein P8J50_03955 [Acidimicrobiales bacterium]|nr:hypothetical protein [Acidimicrobiales bacterium]
MERWIESEKPLDVVLEPLQMFRRRQAKTVAMTEQRRPDSYDRGIALEPHIGTLNEGSLHAALKADYAEPGDEFEVPLDGFVIDIRRGDLLVEIQTSSFAAMGSKLDRLLPEHRILLVHPIPVTTYLQKPDAPRRKSPKRGSVYDLFEELVSVPTLIDHPNLTVDAVLVSVTKHQSADPTLRRGRGGFRTDDRVLDEVVDRQRFTSTDDLLALVPDELPSPFTTADLAAGAGVRRDVAQRMAYVFRALDVFIEHGRTKAGIQYTRG